MPSETSNYTEDILTPISAGKMPGELDRGGYWSSGHGIWVDANITQFIEKMEPSERIVVEKFTPIALSVATLFAQQLQDGAQRQMWPGVVYGHSGGTILVSGALMNPAITDPFALVNRGLNHAPTSFSHAYPMEISKLRHAISGIALLGDPISEEQRIFLSRLEQAYVFDPERSSDLPFIRDAEVAWVGIPADERFLMFAQPMEVYYDTARMHLSGDKAVNEWARSVERSNGLGPWKAFFESRLLVTDESMIRPEEVQAIRRKSKELFGDLGSHVSASTEFRRVLISAGNGAHPHKTAKNYPNFTGIRDTVGYKNIHYTNMIRLGTLEKVKPALLRAFGSNVFGHTSDAELIRGRALVIVGHEENHAFRRHEGNQEMEELKSTIDGLCAVITNGSLSDSDIEAALLTEIGALLYGKTEIDQLTVKGELIEVGSRMTYHVGDTIFMNLLVRHGIFRNSGEIDITSMKAVIVTMVDDLEEFRIASTGALTDRSLLDVSVWGNFRTSV